MMRTKRMLALVAAVAMLATACGDGATDAQDPDPDTGATDEPGAAEEADEAPAAAGEVTLRWRTRPDNQAEIDVYQEVSDTIDAAWDVANLEYEPGGTETAAYQDVLRTEIAAGTAPDVFWIPGTDIADFAQRGLILDLRDIADSSASYPGDDAFFPGPMELLTFDPVTEATGPALWGLPRDVSTFALYLNNDLIAEAGAPDPRELAEAGEWDWDSFTEVAAAVSGLGDEIRGFGMNAWWANPGVFINSAGGSFFNEDRTASNLASDESIAGLEFLTSIYENDLAIPYGEDSEPPYFAGQVGMFLNGRWATPGARSSANFDWDVVRVPDGPAGPVNWLFWGAYVVNANTEYPEEAFELMTRLTSGESQTLIASLGANIPSRTDDPGTLEEFLTFTPPENNQAFIDGLNTSVPEGPLWQGDWPAFDSIMAPAFEAVLSGSMTPEEFRATIPDQLDATFD